MQTWPQMMPMGGGARLLLDIPTRHDVADATSVPHPHGHAVSSPCYWMPFVWVLVLVPAELPGLADVSSGPAANAPVVRPPSLVAAPVPTPTENAAHVTSPGETGKVNVSPVVGMVGAALPLAATLPAGGLSEPVSIPVVPPVDEKTVTAAAGVKPPLPGAVPAEAVIPTVAAEAGKASPVQAASLARPPPPPGLVASPAVEPAPLLAAPTIFAVAQ